MKKSKTSISNFINLNELCEWTGWSKNTAYKYIKHIPEIKTYHFGRFLRFDREEVLEWIKSQTK